MITELDVYLNEDLAGKLSTVDGGMQFSYAGDVRRRISVGMPVEQATFGDAHCEAFFGGLLPEASDARKALGRRFGISGENTFSLLRAIGAECAGALSILESGTVPPDDHVEQVVELGEAELAQHIRELPQRPLFVGVHGLKLSLSGVQDKAAVLVTQKGIAIPSKGVTSHILKPDLQHARGAVFSEHLCLRLAARKKVGITAAAVEMGKAEDQVFLLVQRYDRTRSGDGQMTRIHQEDFCQALGIPSRRKYQDDGGPTLKDCFALLDKSAAPVKERLKLLKIVIFNFLVGNMDAHGKNFSLLHGDKGITLAPLYDVVCTRAFPEYSKKLAMDVADYFEPEEIFAYHWRTFCDDIGYSFPAFKKLAKELYTSLPAEAEAVYAEMQAEGWSHPVCEGVLEIIKSNCAQMETRLNAK